MPFFGQDWRSPGEQWVRTSEGWERMKLWRVKIFENLNENAVARIHRLSLHEYVMQDFTPRRQPYVYYNQGGSREKLESTSLSEALFRLDMAGAVRDIRRANYVFQLVVLIFKEKLSSLSGTSQKLVFGILESMMDEAIKTEINYGGMKDLLNFAQEALSKGHYSHIGSPALWSRHLEIVEHLSKKLTDYQLKEREGDGKIMLTDLPMDCLRIIFSQIADHKDILRAGQTSLTMNHVAKEKLLWKQMCLFHFSNKQILTFFPKEDTLIDIDWEYIYRRCYKRYGRRDVYADMLAICSNCCSIHWKSLGHPCISAQPGHCKILSPSDFLNLFKL